MLIPLDELYARHSLDVSGVLHVGAHLAEEAPDYAKARIPRVLWVEGNQSVLPKLEAVVRQYHQTLIDALVTDEDGQVVDFHVTNYDGMSSSVLDFGLHAESSPDTVFVETVQRETTTIDTLLTQWPEMAKCNFLNLDIQGAELLALKGARNYLEHADYIYTEINIDYVYKDCALLWEIDEFLVDFVRVDTALTPAKWGDGFYIRKTLLP